MPIPPFTDFHVTFKRRRDAEEMRQEVERRRMKERLEEEKRKKKQSDQGFALRLFQKCSCYFPRLSWGDS